MRSIYDDDFELPHLSRYSFVFPDPRSAPKEGLLAYGGDLSASRILYAYRQGIFPWYNRGDPILWWSPDPRLILYPDQFIVRKSFRKVLRNRGFKVTFDTAFEDVISHCATVKNRDKKGSWILPEMVEAYTSLHYDGFAHSVEVHLNDELVGGLYGLALGGVFFGESMFSLVSDSSKVAFKALSDVLGDRGYDFIDCQMPTEHMQRLGAKIVSREVYLNALPDTLERGTDMGSWSDWQWEYRE